MNFDARAPSLPLLNYPFKIGLMLIPPAPSYVLFCRMRTGSAQQVHAQFAVWNEPQAAFACRLNPLYSYAGKQHTGWPKNNTTRTINNFKKTRDRMKSLCALSRIKFFPSKMTWRTLILMKAFWFYGRFSDAMSFSRFALLSQKSQFTYRRFSIVWLPRVKYLLLLCKAEPAWIKRSIHYVILQHYNPGELLKEIPPYLKCDFDTKGAHFENYIASEEFNSIQFNSILLSISRMALESKRLHQNH